MGFRYRKSFGSGPFRMTVSKSGVGYSVGGKGARVTKKAGGGMRTTAGIAGTGLTYTTETGARNMSRSGKRSQQKGKSGCLGCFGSFALVLALLALIGSCDSFTEETDLIETESITISTEASEDIQESNLQEVTEVPMETVEEEPVRVEEQKEQSIIVYITDTGTKYHKNGCGHLEDSKREIDLEAAIAQGYEPCGTCY